MNFDHARYNMVEQQVRTWDVLDERVLGLLEDIHREDFVPVRYRKLAFADLAIPLEHGQVMMKPVVEGRMLQAVDVQPDESVLEIGTGSGFVTACLARLARNVVSVDIFEDFSKAAGRALKEKELHNIELHSGDVLGGWEPEQAHDVLLVTGSISDVPEHFRGWVNPGGRMFIVNGESPAMEARLLTRLSISEWREESLFETDLLRLVNAEQPPQFEF
jgi:protein-L-isoaspartate(D-aspartate) O-methyltransferase